MTFSINGWLIFRENNLWVARSEDDGQFVEAADSLNELTIKLYQIDHPERCSE